MPLCDGRYVSTLGGGTSEDFLTLVLNGPLFYTLKAYDLNSMSDPLPPFQIDSLLFTVNHFCSRDDPAMIFSRSRIAPTFRFGRSCPAMVITALGSAIDISINRCTMQ